MKQILLIWFLFILFCAEMVVVFPVLAGNKETEEINTLISDE